MKETKISRLILKKDDVLVLRIPYAYFKQRDTVQRLYTQVKEKLVKSGKMNKVMLLPMDMDIQVIGKDEVNEFVSKIDIWNLFLDDKGEENV